jgi:two-component system sensor histidine kinase ChiS
MANKASIYKRYIKSLIVIPTLVLGLSIIIGYFNYSIVLRDKQFIYLNSAEKISSLIDSSFNYIWRFSKVVGDRIALQPVRSPKIIGEILQKAYSVAQIGQDVSALTQFDFVTPNGKVIANVSDGPINNQPTVKKEDRAWMTLAPAKPWTLHITPEPVKGIVGEGHIVDYGIPAGFGITDSNNNFIGIVSAGIDVNKLVDKIKHDLNDDYIHFLIVTKDFKFVASSNNKAYQAKDLIKLKKLIDGNHSYGRLKNSFAYEDIEYLAYQVLDHYPFIVIVGENEYLFERSFRERVLPQVILSAVISILILTLFIFFRNRLVIPIKELSDIAYAISDGNMDIKVGQYAIVKESNKIYIRKELPNQSHVWELTKITIDQELSNFFDEGDVIYLARLIK